MKKFIRIVTIFTVSLLFSRVLQAADTFNTLDAFGGSGVSAGQLQGTSLGGTTAIGNPVGIGGVYNLPANLPTYTTGQRGDVQQDSRGNTRVVLMTPDNTTSINASGDNTDAVGVTSSLVDLKTITRNTCFNGTSWDRCRGDVNGQITQPFAFAASNWSYAAATGGISNTTTAVTIRAAQASLRNCITSLQVSDDTLGAATELAIRDGAAGTVLWRMKLGTTAISPYQVMIQSPICNSAVNTLLEVVTLTASVTGGVFVDVQGFSR